MGVELKIINNIECLHTIAAAIKFEAETRDERHLDIITIKRCFKPNITRYRTWMLSCYGHLMQTVRPVTSNDYCCFRSVRSALHRLLIYIHKNKRCRQISIASGSATTNKTWMLF